MSDLCTCFPEPAELARLAENVTAGRPEAFVGTGDPDTQLACPHGTWRLGDVLAEPARACAATTKAGDPCKGTPGDDGFCAAHKPKGDADAAAGAGEGTDPPPEEEGQGEEDDRAEDGAQEGAPQDRA